MATTDGIFIELDPMGAPRQSQRDRWAKRPVVVRYRAWRDALRAQVEEAGWTVPERLSLRFGFAMPASWSQTKRQRMHGQPHQQKPDLDNAIKAVLDALLEEDAHVWQVSASKTWTWNGCIYMAEIEEERNGQQD